MPEFELIADGLRFPEGPVVMADGSIIVVEIESGHITRCYAGGRKELVADVGGGPNGLAIGPDGALYCCNNGGFEWKERNGLLGPAGIAKDWQGGSIQRIDLTSGKVETLYQSGDHGVILRGPNDIVFDDQGGFWFTDHGKINYESRVHDVTGIFYAKADGSFIEEVVYPAESPNGIGLSPDGKSLYSAESYVCRLVKYEVSATGKLQCGDGEKARGKPFYRPAGQKFFDSLAVEAGGNIAVATVGECGISVVSPDGDLVEFVETDDLFTTNIAFGGEDMRDAYITLSGTGRLVKTRWNRAGLKLNYNG